MWRGFFRPYNLRSSSIPLIRNIHGAAVPQIVGFVANLTFVPLYASRCLNLHFGLFTLSICNTLLLQSLV